MIWLPLGMDAILNMRRHTIQLIHMAIVAALLLPVAFAQSERTVWDGVYTEDQAERGRNAYLASCARCHGDNRTPAGWQCRLTTS